MISRCDSNTPYIYSCKQKPFLHPCVQKMLDPKVYEFILLSLPTNIISSPVELTDGEWPSSSDLLLFLFPMVFCVAARYIPKSAAAPKAETPASAVSG